MRRPEQSVEWWEGLSEAKGRRKTSKIRRWVGHSRRSGLGEEKGSCVRGQGSASLNWIEGMRRYHEE